MVSSSTVCCLSQLAAQLGGFPGALPALAVACRHAAYALYNSRGHHSRRIRSALECFAAAQQIRRSFCPSVRALLAP